MAHMARIQCSYKAKTKKTKKQKKKTSSIASNVIFCNFMDCFSQIWRKKGQPATNLKPQYKDTMCN